MSTGVPVSPWSSRTAASRRPGELERPGPRMLALHACSMPTDSTTFQSVSGPPEGGACEGTVVAILNGMRVQVAPCERYRLRVTSWGSGAPPHAIVLPGISADWRALAPQIRNLRHLGWTVHVVDLHRP